MTNWDVYVDRDGFRQLVDSVYFDEDMSMEEVRSSLINHDGLPSDIILVKRR